MLIGVIGHGSIGLRHKTNLWKHLGQTEVMSYDPDPEKQSGTGWVIGDLNKLIEMSDAVVIASPTELHEEHIRLCTGKPMFVEAPIMKIGVIGLGSVGFRHANNLVDMGHEVFGYDPNVALGGTFVQKWDGNYAKKLDAVVIASPTNCHNDHMIDCLSAGKPCLIEKPLGGPSDRIAVDLFQAAEKKNITVMVGYNLRFHPCVIQAKKWIDEGFLQKPLWANFTLAQRSEKPPYVRDGVILNWSHEIDLALYLLGHGSVSGSSTRLSDGRDDLTDILFQHDNGCRSVIHLDYLTEPQIRQSVIVGKKAHIIMDLVSHAAWLRGSNNVILEQFSAEGMDWNDTYVDEMKAFLERINGKETLGATGEEGLEVLKVCLEVRKQAGL